MRTFLIGRATDLEIRKETFEVPTDFSVDDYLWTSFGIWSKSGNFDVRVKVDATLSEYISENIWHPTQSIEPLKNGGLVLRFKLGSLEEIAQWILSWGAHAEAMEPQALRKLVKARAQSIVDLY